MTPKKLTLEAAQKIAEQSDYAFAASDTEHNPINWGDASAFVLEGYKACFVEPTRWNDPKEVLPEEGTEVLVKYRDLRVFMACYENSEFGWNCYEPRGSMWYKLKENIIIGWREIHE